MSAELAAEEREALGIRHATCGCCYIVDSVGFHAVIAARERATEQRVRAEIAAEIEAVDQVEWPLLGMDAGHYAARIARGASVGEVAT